MSLPLIIANTLGDMASVSYFLLHFLSSPVLKYTVFFYYRAFSNGLFGAAKDAMSSKMVYSAEEVGV